MKKLPVLTLAIAATAAVAKPELTVYTYDAFAADWGPARRSKRRLKRSVIAI